MLCLDIPAKKPSSLTLAIVMSGANLPIGFLQEISNFEKKKTSLGSKQITEDVSK